MKLLTSLFCAVLALSGCGEKNPADVYDSSAAAPQPKLSQRTKDIQLARCHARNECQDEAVTEGERAYVAEMQAKWAALSDSERQRYMAGSQSANHSGGDPLMWGIIGYMVGSSLFAHRPTGYVHNHYYTPPAATQPQTRSHQATPPSQTVTPGKPASNSYGSSGSSGSSYGSRQGSSSSASNSGNRASGSGSSSSGSSSSSSGSRSSSSGSSYGGSRSSGSSYGGRR